MCKNERRVIDMPTVMKVSYKPTEISLKKQEPTKPFYRRIIDANGIKVIMRKLRETGEEIVHELRIFPALWEDDETAREIIENTYKAENGDICFIGFDERDKKRFKEYECSEVN